MSVVKRPGWGTKGKPAKVAINAYPVTQFPSSIIHQYDCQIGSDGSKRGLITKLWNHPKVQNALGAAAKDKVLFDGSRLAWCCHELPIGDQLNIVIDLDEGQKGGRPGRDNKHRIVIRKSGRVPLQVLQAYLNGQTDYSNDVLVGITFIDHLLRETPSKNFLSIKRSFFKRDDVKALGGGVEAWKGIFQSARPAQGGKLIINVDVATSVFWCEGTVVDLACQLLRMSTPDTLINAFRNEGPKGPTMRLLRRLKKTQYFCKHRTRDTAPGQPKRVYTIEGFVGSAKEVKFELRRTDANGNETTSQTTVAQYYLKDYNIRLKYPDLPMVKTRKLGEYYPMELCYVNQGQRYPYKLNETQTAEMIKFTVTQPSIRQDHIKRNVALLDWGKDPVLNAYGLKTDPNMLKTNARILNVPKIEYAVGSQDRIFAPMNGRWDLRNKKFIKCPRTPLKSWGIMVFNNPRMCDENSVKNFIRVFITTYTKHGGIVEAKEPPIMYADRNKAVATNLFELFKKSGNKANMKPQMLLFILPAKSPQPYGDIKAYCDIQIGVPSQCLQTRHVLQAKEQYCSNVCMKLNAKLGGSTNKLSKDSNPLTGKGPTLVLGADVSHSAPGREKTSYASMVGSIDGENTRFAAIANINGSRVEVINTANMTRFVHTMLRSYRACTGQIPGRILYFRDGVSEGEYEKIINEELADMKAACRSIQANYAPSITVTICSKRHHFRFFPIDRHAMDRNSNPVPGTIVDRDITHPTQYDFFLNSHNALQGTSRPVHYHVIHDECKMPIDDLQAFVYNSCYTYIRSTTSVSLVPATYYAHLASARARMHEPIHDDGFTVSSSTDVQAPPNVDDSERSLKALHDDMKSTMWYV